MKVLQTFGFLDETLDFGEFCRQMGVSPVRHAYFDSRGKVVFLPNLFAGEVVTLLESAGKYPISVGRDSVEP